MKDIIFKIKNNPKPHKKKYFVYIILIALLALIGILFYKNFQMKKFMMMGNPMQMPNETEVSVIKASITDIDLFKEYPARISAKENSEVRPQVNGIIQKITFQEGSYVKAGKQLYQIDPAPYISEYKKAVAQVKSLSAKAKRYKSLLQMGGVSKQDYDDLIASLESAKADADNARINVGYTKVYAPISGFISTTNMTIGALVSALQAQPLATITNLDTIYADIVIPSGKINEIQRGSNIKVSINIRGEEIYGSLKVAGFIIDSSTDTIKLRAEFKDTKDKLLPGMFVNARLHLPSFKGMLIPQRTATVFPNGNIGVWVVKPDGIVHTQIIKPVSSDKDKWIIKEGLNDGDIIVYEGFQKIREGSKVKSVPVSNVKL
jgi:membrane fusion protein (multidrug efflux system)